MKKLSIFLLLLIGTLAFAQAGSITIYNFSAHSMQYRLVGTNDNSQPIDCQPILDGSSATALLPSNFVVYSQYNSSQLNNPAINSWSVISDAIGIPSQTYNVAGGVFVPTAVSNGTSWQSLNINFSNGEFMQLARDCGFVNSGGGAFNQSTPSGITGTWNYIGNNVIVFIN